MKPEAFARARQENLVRPNVTRREIIVFRKRLSEEAQRRRSHSDLLAEERDALKRRIAELAHQQELAERRLEEINRELGSKQTEDDQKMVAASQIPSFSLARV